MNIYIHLILVALITIYIVDISGFTESWRGALAKAVNRPVLRPLKPFDCSLCMTFWACCIYALYYGQLSVWTIALSAFLSLLSNPLGGLLIFIREWMIWLIDKGMPRG